MTPRRTPSDSRLPRFSLDRRITVLVLLATALVVGGVAAFSIPVELFPQGFEDPFLRLFIPWRDAPPHEVVEKITEPLEEELSTVRGLDRVVSVSSTGVARVYMSFKQNTDMDVAYREVRDRIERARREFPSDVDRIYTFKDDVSGIPVFVLGVAVDPTVTDYYNLLQKQVMLPLERLDGVANVEANGLEEKEILIELDRDRTEASGLNIYDLAQDLGADSFTMASGHVRDAGKKLLLRSVARYDNVEELRQRPVSKNVRLKDIATITYAEPDKEYRVRAMSKPAYAIVVFKEGEANAQEVSARIRKVVDDFGNNGRLAGTEVVTLFDQGEMIEESLSTLTQSGAIGGLVAAFVLFFFLRRLRMTMVVNLAVPLSLLISLTVMFFAGETINILSLLALMVCVGLLVDNSVVVAENIERLRREGATRRDAAIGGAGEIGLAITMSTLTTVIVFLPVALVEGPGQFFLLRMAIPICVALVASLIVALVCIPLGTYLTLPAEGEMAADRTAGATNGELHRGRSRKVASALATAYRYTFGVLNVLYNRLLGVMLQRRLDFSLVLFLIFAGSIGVMKAAGVSFSPFEESEDAGFEIDVEMPTDYTLEETEAWFLEAEQIVENHAEEFDLEGWFQFHDKTDGELQGWFKNPRTNDLTREQVTERLVEMLPIRPGMEVSTGEESQIEDASGESVFAVTLNGQDVRRLDDFADDLKAAFLRVDGVIGARKSNQRAPNELGLVVDRDRSQQLGVNPQVVAGLVGYALRGQSLPKYRDQGREVPVRVRFQEEDRESLVDLRSFYVPTEAGEVLPISAVTNIEMLESPEYIVRRDKRIARSITLDLKEETAEETRERLGLVMAGMDLPEGISFSAESPRDGLNEDLKQLNMALLLAIVFIYLLMGLLFESFILPLSIVLTIPLAFIGVIWIHVFARSDIDFLGAVGVVLLVGVVVNNGIVLIDYVNRLREGGAKRNEAILEAARLRFRPIMMTAITTIGGMVPLAVAGKMDSGLSYTSFAYTLIGGMTTATFLTLLVVPIFYTMFDDVRTAFGSAMGRARRQVLDHGAEAIELESSGHTG